MAREDVRHALVAMDDDDVRAQLAAGDFSGVAELDLTADEQSMVQNAANDYPEVAGFSVNSLITEIGFPALDLKGSGKHDHPALSIAFTYANISNV
jgi:hypothetical protein